MSFDSCKAGYQSETAQDRWLGQGDDAPQDLAAHAVSDAMQAALHLC
jgi:hypothetical protein